MAYEELETLPRGLETPNIYGPADAPLSVQESQLIGSVRKNDKAFVQDVVWTSQPQQAVGIDWGNSICNGLIDVIYNSEFSGLGRKIELGASASFTKKAGNNGISFNELTQIENNGHLGVTNAGPASGAEVTLLFLGKLPTGGTQATSATVTNGMRLIVGGNGVNGFIGHEGSWGGSTVNFALANSGVQLVIATMVPFSTGDIYCNGAKVGTTGNSGGTSNLQKSVTFGRTGTYTYSKVVEGYLVAGWSRRLSVQEIRNLSDNPWQIFKPIPAKLKHYIPQQPLLPSKVGVPGLIEQSKRTWTSQPQGPLGIDWGNPITKGLICTVNPALGRKFIDPFGTTWTAGSAQKLTQSSSNISFLGEYSSGIGLVADRGIGLTDSSTEYTLLFYVSGGSGTGMLLSSTGGFNNIGQNGSNYYSWQLSQFFGPATIGKYDVIVATRSGSTGYLYMNGRRVTSAAATDLSIAGNTTLMCRNSTGSVPYLGNMACFHAWNRALSDAEVSSISQNPWQVFQPLSYKQFVGQNTLPNIQVYREKLMWTQQPQLAVGIDWGNPITRGLKAYCFPAIYKGTVVPYRSGLATNGAVNIIGDSYSTGNSLQEFTLFSVCVRNGTSNSSNGQYPIRLRSTSNVNSSSFHIGCTAYSNNRTIASAMSYQDYTNTTVSSTLPAIGVNEDLSIAATFKSNSIGGHILFINGAVASSIDTPNKTLFTDVSRIHFSDASGGTNNTGLPTYIGIVWHRALSSSEIANLHQNPWQIFKPIPRRIENRTSVKPQPLLPKYSLVRTSQPQTTIEIDWSNPLTKGIIDVLTPFNGNATTPQSTGNIGNGKDTPIDYTDKTQMSFLWFGQKPTFSSYMFLLKGNGRFELAAESTNNGKFNCSVHGATWNTGQVLWRFSGISITKPTVLVGTFSANVLGRCYYNGYEISNTGANTGSLIAESQPTGDRVLRLYGSLGIRWKRELSASEVKSLSENPWQIFKPIKYPARLK